MDFKSVRQLADLMEERGLTNIEICEGDNKISLSKESRSTNAAPNAALLPEAGPAPAQPLEPQEKEQPGDVLKAPLVGVVYLASKPGAAPFVQVGQKVKKGQILCIMEAMKVMNEFTAPRDGEVAEIYPEDAQMVEYGQPLFRLL
ncbi:MAG: acetyl-CoA carboxylase biotin carboxyl carrier protein [Oscillospiraceae bacterium]